MSLALFADGELNFFFFWGGKPDLVIVPARRRVWGKLSWADGHDEAPGVRSAGGMSLTVVVWRLALA